MTSLSTYQAGGLCPGVLHSDHMQDEATSKAFNLTSYLRPHNITRPHGPELYAKHRVAKGPQGPTFRECAIAVFPNPCGSRAGRQGL